MSLSMIFTACDGGTGKTPDDKIPTENAEEIADLRIYYNGCLSPYFPNYAQFTYETYTGSVAYNPKSGSLSGTGLVIQLLQVVSYENGYFPTCTKNKPFEIEGNSVVEIFEGGAVGVQVIEIENGAQTGNNMQTQVFRAETTGDADQMVWVIECDFDGEIRTFKFDGEPQIAVGGAFTKENVESTVKVNGEETYAQAEVVYYGDIDLLPVNIIEVILISKDNSRFADLICYGSLDNVENVYGTYTVDVKHNVGKMAKSAGMHKQEGYVFPSFITRNYSQNGADYYLVDSGTLTVEEGKITFDLTSENGSTFKTTYEGEFTIKSSDEAYGAPQFKAPQFKASAEKGVYPLNYDPIKLF